MKSIIKVAALLVMASLGQGSPQGGGVQYVDPGPTPLRLWLYWGKFSLYDSSVRWYRTHKVDDNGEKYYPASGKPGMTLNGKCHKNMIDYDGVWVDKDPRDVRQTCVKVYEDDACEGNWDPIKIETSSQCP